MKPHPTQVRLAAILGALAVILGAFGAHALKDVLVVNGTMDVWKTASQYHALHGVVLLVLGLVGGSAGKLATWSWNLLAVGTTIFSGSLYLLAVTNLKWLGAITPIGGLCMIIGWLLVAARRWQ